MTDETCWFLAADFEKQSWQRGALAFLKTCREHDRHCRNERAQVLLLRSGS
jgi:hypothetical protein